MQKAPAQPFVDKGRRSRHQCLQINPFQTKAWENMKSRVAGNDKCASKILQRKIDTWCDLCEIRWNRWSILTSASLKGAINLKEMTPLIKVRKTWGKEKTLTWTIGNVLAKKTIDKVSSISFLFGCGSPFKSRVWTDGKKTYKKALKHLWGRRLGTHFFIMARNENGVFP